MFQKRQTVPLITYELATPVLARAENHQHGWQIPWHAHDLDQLIHATQGVMTVETAQGFWVVPPERAVWVPAYQAHTIRMTGAVALRSLYLRPSLKAIASEQCCVVQVSPILTAGIVKAIEFEQPYGPNGAEHRLVAVMLDEMLAATTAPLQLLWPKDSRARRVARAFQDNVTDRRLLAQWALVAGVSARTLERLFQHDTGVTFSAWQRQVRLLRALEVMASGANVTAAALEVGFETPSAFIVMFRRAMGVTPAKYFRHKA